MRRGRLGTLVAVVAALSVAAPCASAAAPSRKRPAVFRVGAAVAKLTPPVPVFSGGFGLSPPISKLHDPLTARAFYVAGRGHAVAFVTVDAQGYFASYQESPALGITDERATAARRITKLVGGAPPMTRADIVVQATHSHAAPTLEGIWGPSPRVYLQLVHDRVVKALVAAARRARPAYLQSATVDANRLDTHVIDTDSYPGWANDGQLTVLRALAPRTRATIATFANVSVHGAHVEGDSERFLSADYFGRASRELGRKLGGIAVVGPGTLGRQESPVEVTDVPTMRWFARIVEGYVERGLGAAHFVTDPTVRGAEALAQVPATNGALVALNHAWSLPDDQKEQEAQASGIYPIDRDVSPPYADGNVLGTWLTAVRIGRGLYLSMPGEPFPEVSHSLRLHARGTAGVTLLSKGQDDLGYFYPSWVYPFTGAYGSDHHLFNVAPQAGDQFIEGQLALVSQLGFRTTPYVPPEKTATEFGRDTEPGLEALAAPLAVDAGRDERAHPVFEAIYSPAKGSSARPQKDKVRWAFGDGTTASTGFLSTGQDYGQGGLGPVGKVRRAHALRPGHWRVAVSALNTDGQPAFWRLPVDVYPRLRARIEARRVSGSTYRLTARVRGGKAPVLAWHWRVGDRRVDGSSFEGALAAGDHVKLTVVDSTGTPARAKLVLR